MKHVQFGDRLNMNYDFTSSPVIPAVSESNHRVIMGRITVACDGQEVSRKTYLSASPYPLFPLTVPLFFVESFQRLSSARITHVSIALRKNLYRDEGWQ